MPDPATSAKSQNGHGAAPCHWQLLAGLGPVPRRTMLRGSSRVWKALRGIFQMTPRVTNLPSMASFRSSSVKFIGIRKTDFPGPAAEVSITSWSGNRTLHYAQPIDRAVPTCRVAMSPIRVPVSPARSKPPMEPRPQPADGQWSATAGVAGCQSLPVALCRDAGNAR